MTKRPLMRAGRHATEDQDLFAVREDAVDDALRRRGDDLPFRTIVREAEELTRCDADVEASSGHARGRRESVPRGTGQRRTLRPGARWNFQHPTSPAHDDAGSSTMRSRRNRSCANNRGSRGNPWNEAPVVPQTGHDAGPRRRGSRA